ncbi:MAG: endonuclease/exonuclease/phosphatase family protein [Chlorobi bacterium]|nr:endonuclease/exonuclease/phosphatase family protein [Chlorobiota bacterium]
MNSSGFHYHMVILLGLCVVTFLLAACQTAEQRMMENEDLSPVNVDAEILTIGFYNVENLFDPIDDPKTADDDFMPTGKMKWTSERFDTKLENLARAIRLINDNNGPDILGLCEVENRFVLERLTNEFLPEGIYGIVHTDSPDGRGIDVALIYRKSMMLYKGMKLHKVPLPSVERPTRGILEVTLEKGGKFLTVLVNHWPSRSGGKVQTEPKRVIAATTAASVIDSLTSHNPNADIVMIGDFNDEPSDASIRERLRGLEYPDGQEFDGRMINLAVRPSRVDTIGSYLYRDSWLVLDQIMVSPGVLDENGLILRDRAMTIFHPEFLRDYHPSQPLNPPRRTFVRGTLYIGGTSDHFPVFARFGWRE